MPQVSGVVKVAASEAALGSRPKQTGIALAVGFMMVSAVLMTVMHSMVRHVGQELHPFEVAFFRNLFGLLAVLPLVMRAGLGSLRTQRPGLHIFRGLLGVFAMMTWFYALAVVPIAEATALSFTWVIFASMGAVLLLGEKMRMRRWLAVALGLAGVMVILRPGFQDVGLGALLVVVSSITWGMAIVIVKRLSSFDSVVCIVAWMAMMLTVLSFFPALLVWTWPSLEQLFWLVLIGATATFAHLAMTRALQLADATAVLPLDFTRLVWASMIGYFAFAEIPDLWTWVGGGVIVASATYIIYRESKLKQKVATAPPLEETRVP